MHFKITVSIVKTHCVSPLLYNQAIFPFTEIKPPFPYLISLYFVAPGGFGFGVYVCMGGGGAFGSQVYSTHTPVKYICTQIKRVYSCYIS